MAVTRGLGKGLDLLISDNPKKKESTIVKTEKKKIAGGQLMMKITAVEPNRNQPRKNFEEDALIELSESIKQVGILSPLLVQKKDDYYEIIAGERRWRAAKLAGLKEVPVIIKDYTPQQILEISLIENIQRERLNPIEEAFAYQKLVNEFQLKQDEVAERVSKSRTAVTNSLRLLKLDQRVQDMIVNEMISTGHARALVAVSDPELQYEIATRVFDEKLSVREIEKLVKEAGREKKEKKTDPQKEQFAAVFKEAAEKMSTAVGSKVLINQKSRGKGKIEIEYYSDSELERIMDLILSVQE